MQIERLQHKFRRGELKTLNIGVTGGSAVGKSSFINVILDQSQEDKTFANTGHGETTLQATIYQHPKYGGLTFTDMPGYGTISMPTEKFLKDTSFSNFTYFLVLFDTVIKEDDILIAERLHESGIPFSFVRTKLDTYVKNAKQIKEADKAIRELRAKLKYTICQKKEFKDANLFLISNKEENLIIGDLTKLMKEIFTLIPDGKIEQLLFFLSILTPETLRKRDNELKNRIWKVSMIFGLLSAFPVPGLAGIAYLIIIRWEINRYFRMFGLNKKFVPLIQPAQHALCRNQNFKSNWEVLWSQVSCHLPIFGAVVLCPMLGYYFPNYGYFISGTINVFLMRLYLKSNVKQLKDDAATVYKHFIR